LHVEHLALAIIDGFVGRLNLIDERFYLSKRMAAGSISWLGVNDASRS